MKHGELTRWSLGLVLPVLLQAGGCRGLPVVYVQHVELPRYPPLAWQTGLEGTVVMTLNIGAHGKVVSAESENGNPQTVEFGLFREAAEKDIRTWIFGCAGCRPNAPFQHTIRFKYIRGLNLPNRTSKSVMDLPDGVTVYAGPIFS